MRLIAKRIGWVLLGALWALQCGAMTISQPKPDRWFIPELKLDEHSLPPGVTFDRETGSIQNNTKIPLYIGRQLETPMLWLRHLPANMTPDNMLVEGRLMRHSYDGTWSQIAGKGKGRLGVLEALTYSERRALRNPIAWRGHGRPNDQSVPPPEKIHFTLYYGAQELNLSGWLSYRLNDRYSPTARLGTTPSEWYRVDAFTPDNWRLPKGVFIQPSSNVNYVAEFRNETSTPLYTVKRHASALAWRGKFPADILPVYRVVSGTIHRAQLDPDTTFSTIDLKSGKVEFQSTTASGWSTTSGSLQVHIGWLEYLRDPPKLDNPRKDCRPRNVALPKSLPVELPAYFGAAPYPLHAEVVFTLNRKYDPLAGLSPPGCASCSGPQCQQCAAMDRNPAQWRAALAGYCEGMMAWKPMATDRPCEVEPLGAGRHRGGTCDDFVFTNTRVPQADTACRPSKNGATPPMPGRNRAVKNRDQSAGTSATCGAGQSMVRIKTPREETRIVAVAHRIAGA